jgi:hypothetical protein
MRDQTRSIGASITLEMLILAMAPRFLRPFQLARR